MAILKSSLVLSLIDNVSGRAKGINGALNGIRASQTALLGTMGRIAAFGAAYIGVTQGITGTAGAAIEFETAFANVQKVINGTDEQMQNMRRSIIGLSKELPIAAGGIAEIYAAAGQSNIPIAELNKFAEMVAKVSTAWDVPVAETGDALAKIKTQLNLGVAEVGLFADSLNHLANNTAANAPNLLEYTSRVAATGEMFGFSAQETLAFGGAMISAGAESEVAATSFRNMGRALTIGTRATKMQNTAFSRLGLDSVKTAKNMQKNALGTTLDVIERIQKLPEWERISMASALFGDEARALMPAINNSTELRRQLGLIGDQANYAGSAFEEYAVRANTVGNVLQILQNKFADVFRGIGDRMLPRIREAALGVGDILDTLGERGHVFAQMDAAMQGFMKGMGFDGGIREAINELGDLFFGEADGSAAADKIGRIFMKFKQWGADIREFSAAVAANPIAQFFAQMAPYGFQIMLWSTGILMLAGTIRKLASALMFLSGASAIIGALKTVGAIAALVGGAGKAVPGGAPKGGPTSPGSPGSSGAPKGGGLMGTLKAIGAASLALGVLSTLGGNGEVRQLTADEQAQMFQRPAPATPTMPGLSAFTAQDNANRARAAGFGGSTENLPGKTADDVAINASSIAALTRPTGVQQVLVTNPSPIQLTVHAPISITGVADGTAAGTAAANQLGSAVKSAVEGSYSDGPQ